MGHLNSRSPEFTDPELIAKRFAWFLSRLDSLLGADEDEDKPEYAHWGEG